MVALTTLHEEAEAAWPCENLKAESQEDGKSDGWVYFGTPLAPQPALPLARSLRARAQTPLPMVQPVMASKCARCSLPILDRCTHVEGEVYHCNCFACADCCSPITGKYIKDGNRYRCEKCNTARAPKCDGCQQPILSKFTTAHGKTYHVECFVCTTCCVPLPGSYFSQDGEAVCQGCHEIANPPHVCSACHTPIKGPATVAKGRSYHTQCFRCSKCRMQMSGDCCVEAKTGDGFVCTSCQPRCSLCRDPLAGRESLCVGAQTIHKSCFRCTDCNNGIDGSYFPAGIGKHRCIGCHRNPIQATKDKTVGQALAEEQQSRQQESAKPRLF